MIFERYLIPDRIVERYSSVTPEFLAASGIRGLICDIDNTLAPYEALDPPPDVVHWCEAMRAAGIRIAFVSNNDETRVARFNRPFGFPAFPRSGKPRTGALRRAMAAMGTDVTSTASLGDQLLTDAAAARRLGMLTIIVPPIRDKKTLFFRLKRWIERPYLTRYYRSHRM